MLCEVERKFTREQLAISCYLHELGENTNNQTPSPCVRHQVQFDCNCSPDCHAESLSSNLSFAKPSSAPAVRRGEIRMQNYLCCSRFQDFFCPSSQQKTNFTLVLAEKYFTSPCKSRRA